MSFNLLRRFLLWFRRVLSRKLTDKESSTKAPSEEKPVQAAEPPRTHPLPIERTTKPRKPYRKKSPLEEKREHGKFPEAGNGTLRVKQRREIDLGGVRKKTQRVAKGSPQIKEKKQTDKEKDEDFLARAPSPFVELDLYEAKVFLVLPEQEFSQSGKDVDFPQNIIYELDLNGEKQKLSAATTKHGENLIRVDEKRIELKNPINSLRVIFPDELEGKDYSYNHPEIKFYAFVATGTDRARMYYLYDEKGNFNPLPKRDIWILLREDYLLNNEPDIIEEIWIWENYQPLRINLKEIIEIVLHNCSSNQEEVIPCEACFWIEGERLVEDDLASQVPVFPAGKIKINSLRQNPFGWTVWVQNKYAGHAILSESWTGVEPLELEVPNQLPCECGEFQVDICERSWGVPEETLFFRCVPGLRLEYCKALTLPDPHHGHEPAIIKVFLKDSGKDFQLSTDKHIQFLGDWHNIEMPPEEDTLSLGVCKRGSPKSVANLRITLPRLKWRISDKAGWSDRLLRIGKDELVTGIDHYLTINTSGSSVKYDILAALEANGLTLQEEKFIRKGTVYTIWLNKFFETICKNSGQLELRTEIQEKSGHVIGKINIMHFYEAMGEESKDKSKQITEKGLKSLGEKIPREYFIKAIAIRPRVICARGMRTGRGFSLQEVAKAGIDGNGLRRLNIRLDKRRKSAHSHNIKTLKSSTEVKKDGD